MIRIPEIVFIGEMNDDYCKRNGDFPSTFYFIEGDTLFLFDYSTNTDRYFHENAELFKDIYSVVLCFSFSEKKYRGKVTPVHDIVRKFINKPMRYFNKEVMHVKAIGVTKRGETFITEYIYSGRGYIESDITTRPDATVTITSQRNITIEPYDYNSRKGFCALTVWMEDSRLEPLLYYTGKRGVININLNEFFIKHPFVQIINFINRESLLECRETLMHTYRKLKKTLKNPIKIVGFITRAEKRQLIRLLS
jgi:hypothetical protein